MIQTRSSLFYNTSARHKRHEYDTSSASATQTTPVIQKKQECDTSATRKTQL